MAKGKSHGKPCRSQYGLIPLIGMVTAMPADPSENLQLSQRNEGPEPAAIARDRSRSIARDRVFWTYLPLFFKSTV